VDVPSTPGAPEWNIPISALPPGSIVKRRPYSFWESDRPQGIAASAGYAGLLLLVVYLAVLTRQLNSARLELSQLNASLEAQVRDRTAELIAANTALTAEVSERQRAEDALHQQLDETRKLQEQLREQSIRDPLTGMFNRRFMQETLDRELARSTRDQCPVAIVMLDLDHFKDLNDSHGHMAGDLVLQAMGELLRGKTRRNDVACRFGGEECVIIMPGVPLDIVTRRADELRAALANLRIPFGGSTLQTTASVGVAVFPGHGKDVDTLLRAADEAMYTAKQAGRDRVVVNPSASA
jgi:diguanylate cyclase (GGDEF)-like protein